MTAAQRNKNSTRNFIKIPVLAYHRVLPGDLSRYTGLDKNPFLTTEAQFRAQMQYLYEHDYEPFDLYKLLGLVYGNHSYTSMKEARKPIALTFDDGWSDNYHYACPILKSYGFTATIFVITSRIGETDYMSWEQLEELQRHDMQIESHGHNHTPLELLSNMEIQWELGHSKRLLEEKLNKRVGFISFPHGSYTTATLEAAKRCDYVACFTSQFGYAARMSSTFEIPRIMLKQHYSQAYFRSLCEGRRAAILRARFAFGLKGLIKRAVGISTYNSLYRLRHRLNNTSASKK